MYPQRVRGAASPLSAAAAAFLFLSNQDIERLSPTIIILTNETAGCCKMNCNSPLYSVERQNQPYSPIYRSISI